MRRLFWLVILSAVLTGLYKALPSHGPDVHPDHSNWKRFLFTTSTNLFCNHSCKLICPSGYRKSPLGCYICACVITNSGSLHTSAPSSGVNFLPSNFSTNAGHVGLLFDKPCDPSVRHCPLQCTIGYQTGTNGCQLCACVNSVPVITISTPSSSSNNPSSAAKTTTLSARTTPSVLYSTVSTAIKATSASSIAASTSPGTTKQHSGYFDPCIPSQIVCTKNCHNAYILGPEGCQYCLCADKIPPNLRATTTTAPRVPTGRSNSSVIKPTVDSKPSTEACIMAKVICNDKCPNGFVSQPDDCLYCSCIKSASVQSDEATATRLRKPCLYKSKTCRTKCIMGYIKGPRNCQFCSCNDF